jgi:hypothetical protein
MTTGGSTVNEHQNTMLSQGGGMAPGPGFLEAPQVTAWNTIASFATYGEAQAAVDRLAASGFPVNELEIVGSGLRSVERVTGPLSWGRAVAGTAATGAWIGLFIGFLVGLFTVGSTWIGLVLGGVLIGAAWGAIYGVTARWLSRGQHNFSSLHGVVATRYDVIGLDGVAGQARSLLGLVPPPVPSPATASPGSPPPAAPPAAGAPVDMPGTPVDATGGAVDATAPPWPPSPPGAAPA